MFSVGLHLLHHLHYDRPGSGQDQVTDSPVVLGEDIQSIHGHHKLAHLHASSSRRPTGVHGLDVTGFAASDHKAPAHSIANNSEGLLQERSSWRLQLLWTHLSLQDRFGVAKDRWAAAERRTAAVITAAATAAAQAAPPSSDHHLNLFRGTH